VKLTTRGLWWLKVNLANLFDQDKISLDARVKWVDDNWEMILEISKDPYTNREWVDSSIKKNKSFQRLAAVFDITRDDGFTYLPVQLDGQCNGSQHWSAIMRDETVADMVGLTPNDKPSDLYQHVADGVTEYCELHKDSQIWCEKFLDHWDQGISRKVTKRPTMCDAYGLTFYGIQKYLKIEGHLDWVTKDKQAGAITELAKGIKASMDRCLHAPNKGKEYLKTIIRVANDLNKHVEWTTPSGFKVVHHYNTINTRRSVAKLFGSKELTFFISTPDVNPKAALQAIAPNYIHSLDAAHMFMVLSGMLSVGIYSVAFVHDSYGCHANYVDDMRDILREEFVSIHKENQLEKFKKEIQNQLGVMLPDPPDIGEFDVNQVLDSDYFFS
jgi:DNA-directed RNA polymerase